MGVDINARRGGIGGVGIGIGIGIGGGSSGISIGGGIGVGGGGGGGGVFFDSGDGIHIVQKIVLKIAINGNKPRKKQTPDPLGKLVRWGGGSCRRDSLLWGQGEEVEGSRQENFLRNMSICCSFYLVCTL